MILIFKHILFKNYNGITIFPFIFLKSNTLKLDKKLINHEKIHLKQQVELLWVFFFIWYFTEYIIGLISYKNHYLAYKNISFEKEAYINEGNLQYLKTRKLFSFYKYIR